MSNQYVIYNSRAKKYFAENGNGRTSYISSAQIHTLDEVNKQLGGCSGYVFAVPVNFTFGLGVQGIVLSNRSIDRVGELERQIGDLLKANNELLERTRKAEAKIAAPAYSIVATPDHHSLQLAACRVSLTSEKKRADKAAADCAALELANKNGFAAHLETITECEAAKNALKALTRTLGGVIRGERIPEGKGKFEAAK